MNLLEMNPHETKIVFLAGSPIRQSNSCSLFNHVAGYCNLNAMFLPREIGEGRLPEFFAACRLMHAHGAMFTMPHKGAASALADDADDISRTFQSVNCLRFDKDKSVGHGFDGKGAALALEQSGAEFAGAHAVILGAGGVGGILAAEFAARGAGKLTLLNRTLAKAARAAENIKRLYPATETAALESTPENIVKTAAEADVFVQATSQGMLGREEFAGLGFIDKLPAGCRVLDVVANPLETRLLKAARERGLISVSGMDMQICQVEVIFDFFFNCSVDAGGRKSARIFYTAFLKAR